MGATSNNSKTNVGGGAGGVGSSMLAPIPTGRGTSTLQPNKSTPGNARGKSMDAELSKPYSVSMVLIACWLPDTHNPWSRCAGQNEPLAT